MIELILMGVIAALAIVIAILFMHYIIPIKNSPARLFLDAKKKKQPLIILDCGNYYNAVVGKSTEDGYIRGPNNEMIFNTPGALKSFEGIMLGIGEDYRKVISTVAVAQILEFMNTKKWDQKKMSGILQILDHTQKEGMTVDEFKDFIKKQGVADENPKLSRKSKEEITKEEGTDRQEA